MVVEMFGFGLGKLGLYLAIALVISGAIGGIYISWKRGIEHQAFLELNQRQLEQTVREQEQFTREQQAIAERQRALVQDMTQRNQTLQRRVDQTNRIINSAAGDRPASDVLKQTIDQLRSEGRPQ
jgi:hypothetical protein